MSGKPQSKAPKVAVLAVDDPVVLDDDAASALEEAAQLQTELDSLSEKCAEEILQVEQRFNKLRKPFVELRSEILKRVPDFWMNAVSNTYVHMCIEWILVTSGGAYYSLGQGFIACQVVKAICSIIVCEAVGCLVYNFLDCDPCLCHSVWFSLNAMGI